MNFDELSKIISETHNLLLNKVGKGEKLQRAYEPWGDVITFKFASSVIANYSAQC